VTRKHKENGAMITRLETKIIRMKPVPEEPAEEQFGQRRRPDNGPFLLQVDRQTKETYATYEEAEAAGWAIKKRHPIVQVTVYDNLKGERKIIELPQNY
jgi:hypothetical protein